MFFWSLWKRSRVWRSARRRLLQYTEGYCSHAAKLLASWNKWMLIKSNVVPSSIHRVRRKPFRLHLHSGKNCCGNFAFSFVAIDSMLPVWIVLPSTGSNSCVKKFQILMFVMESCMKYKLPKAYRLSKKENTEEKKAANIEWIMGLEMSKGILCNWLVSETSFIANVCMSKPKRISVFW